MAKLRRRALNQRGRQWEEGEERPTSGEQPVDADCRWNPQDNCLQVQINSLRNWSTSTTPYDYKLELSPGEMCDLVKALRDGAEAMSETRDTSEVLAVILELALALARASTQTDPPADGRA